MRLTRAGEYAIRCVLYLAAHGTNLVANRKQIAKVMEIPSDFLSKIAQQLAQVGIIEIVQGSKGGLKLTAVPEKLTMLEVIEAVIGEISLNDCVRRPDSCDRSPVCAAHQVWEKARAQLRATLRESTFDTLLKADGYIHHFVKPQGA